MRITSETGAIAVNGELRCNGKMSNFCLLVFPNSVKIFKIGEVLGDSLQKQLIKAASITKLSHLCELLYPKIKRAVDLLASTRESYDRSKSVLRSRFGKES